MKVAIDPGHGMSNRRLGVYDPGAVHVEGSTKYKEAEIALKYGLTLKDIFRAKGHEVFMTRDDQTDHAPVGQRAMNAKSAGAEVFVSLHLNDFDDDAANGLEVLYRGSDDKDLAQKLQDKLVMITGFKDRDIKQRTDLAVLKFDGVAILVELGFIANDGDRATLLNPLKRDEVCNAIASVILDHFS
jgi:N-acetylmuramoyl-L-alanine amidase